MKWGFGTKKGKYRVIDEKINGQDGYTVFGPRGEWAWYGRDTVWIKTKDDALARHISQAPTAWGQLNSLLDESLVYLWAAGWRTLTLWFALNSALYSWEPYRAETSLRYFYLQAYQAEDARKQILWLIALSLAQCWIAFELIKKERGMLFVYISVCSYTAIGVVQYSASDLIRTAYGSPIYMSNLHSVNYMFYFGVGLLLLSCWFHWRAYRDAD